MGLIRRRWPLLLLIVACVASVIPVSGGPPDGTRMVVDHTLGVYIAPPCFDQAEATNNLGEVSWERAQTYDYEPESGCTAELMAPDSMMLWQLAGIRLGLLQGRWGW
ncbi:hypothetical protein [Paenibacillus sp. 1P07SE]|uniref:hypothetical protein n=1 Tax=Paenibacillus sp. 1P07SE TaxID=3132209 RepID=UPI0039A72894